MALPTDIEASIIKVAGDMAIYHSQSMLTQQKTTTRLDQAFKTFYLQLIELVEESHNIKQ
jgi:hypothetical protein